MPRLLVCDDEPAIVDTLTELLSACGHEVSAARDGDEAVAWLRRERFDLVLSDISMPGRNGIEVLVEASRLQPGIHRLLLTAHTLEDYIEQLLGHELSCVLTKSVPFPLAEILGTIEALLSGAIFGLERFVPAPQKDGLFLLRTAEEIPIVCERLLETAPPTRRAHLRTVLSELLTNAVFYGARGERGDDKESWERSFVLPDDQAIEIRWAKDDDLAAISVTDKGGLLERRTVLHWLRRQMVRDENGLPVGIFDCHGRGFFISRSFTDRLAISIEKGRRCEVSLLMHLKPPPAGEKPLIILEI